MMRSVFKMPLYHAPTTKRILARVQIDTTLVYMVFSRTFRSPDIQTFQLLLRHKETCIHVQLFPTFPVARTEWNRYSRRRLTASVTKQSTNLIYKLYLLLMEMSCSVSINPTRKQNKFERKTFITVTRYRKLLILALILSRQC